MLEAIKSHPSWVCGLKHDRIYKGNWADVSHPSWVCGLKPFYDMSSVYAEKVTPFVGVWIETWLPACYTLFK